ncbi:serine/threonine-protein phosphatase 4 regulatory subunit 1 isoform X4 [Halyomorpha halys]|uniref:serine/threonine-protein phosphatase 4 regulatory subunit 1 isoform X4 n=1 Tax=Halyomorpha halys TaxID=286706 RepID=UPI0006D51FCF|nr:serine/threonine-protein phosphatase 4 regulatory subunit 1-like isoform X4 [Halyomorpha halys]
MGKSRIPIRIASQGDSDWSGRDDEGDSDEGILRGDTWRMAQRRLKRQQSVGKTGLETLRALAANPKNALNLLDNFLASSYSKDDRIRCEVIEYVPPLALYLSGEGSNGDLRSLISTHLFPTVIRALSDENSQVVKMGETALLSLLEHCLISSNYIEHKVWPIILSRITHRRNVEATIGVITVISKMAPWIGSDLSERLVVPVLEEMSQESELGIRRVCASLYRDLCSVVSTEVSESRLVPSFLKLCCDPEWVVRQTCAEVFMSVSCKVTLATRKALLAPAFAKLLVDRVRWVQLSAFQSLGPFITTFAEPSITSLGYNNNGELVLKHRGASFEYKLNSTKVDDKLINPLFMAFMMEGNNDPMELEIGDFECNNNNKFNEMFDCRLELDDPENAANSEDKNNESEDQNFNTWQYWREPIPEIEIESSIEESNEIETIDIQEKESTSSEEKDVCSLMNTLDVNNDKEEESPTSDENKSDSDDVSSQENISPESIPRLIPPTPSEGQDIVPQELINHFVSMSDPRRDSAPDLAHHCAYNLPAVALTLGKDNWDLLKPAYETLAADRQWKVRRIVASSIHELAVIVGEDVATQDLVPVFNGFIKDLDEVRIGALKHLAHFLKLLRPAGRNSFLPRLTEFLMTDYDWNWRFRQELAEQLLQSLGLFTPADTCHHLGPVIMALLLDKVASVRKVALVLVTELVAHVSIDVNLLRSLLAELAEQFAHSNRWNRRQTFALLCSRLIKEGVLSEEMFARDVLPHLLDLSWDPVANVRLAVARAAAQHILPNAYFADRSNPHHEVLMAVLKRLQADKDRDVRYFAVYQPPKSEPVEEPTSINSSSEELY